MRLRMASLMRRTAPVRALVRGGRLGLAFVFSIGQLDSYQGWDRAAGCGQPALPGAVGRDDGDIVPYGSGAGVSPLPHGF